VGNEEKVVISPGALDDDARRAYAAAFTQKTDTSGGLNTIEAVLDGALLFDVKSGGVTVARYALRTAKRPAGVEVYVVAAVGSMAGVDLIQTLEPFIVQQCSGAAALTINTRRRGLMRKLQRQGWTVDSVVMRKKIQHGFE
jgi:hypothetical protein